ncbi:hypothetical protein Ancab_007365 [Ancistrocladus abbreviatus]
MAKKVSNFSDLIQRVTASCLLHPLGTNRFDSQMMMTPNRSLRNELEAAEKEDEEETDYELSKEEEEEAQQQQHGEIVANGGGHKCKSIWEERESSSSGGGKVGIGLVREERERCRETELVDLMGQVFEAVSAMKRAYASLQEAHSPWDPEKIRVADAAVVAELRRIGLLRQRFRRGFGGKSGKGNAAGIEEVAGPGVTVRDVVAPYEAAVEELKREVNAKEVEVENLKEKLKSVTLTMGGGNGKKGKRLQSKRKVSCIQGLVSLPLSPSPDLFEATMNQVTEASKAFTSLLLSLMRSAHLDISAAVRSIEVATSTTATDPIFPTTITTAAHHQHYHAKYALESYISRKIFHGFDHETFYMDGTLFSLLNPDQFRKDCFSKYRDMKSMDPTELLGILPTCQFGVFCTKKYLSILHPSMEESLFGDLEQRRQVLAGSHPRTRFYAEFLALAKAVWMLHLLAFSLDPPPSHFEASHGSEFHPEYMESVVRFLGGNVPSGLVVGFSVSPGFKFGTNGSVIKARVYLVPKS